MYWSAICLKHLDWVALCTEHRSLVALKKNVGESKIVIDSRLHRGLGCDELKNL